MLVILTSCVPIAYPPITGDVGVTRTTERSTRTGLHVNAGLSPLHFTKSMARTRRFDATLGGSFDRVASRTTWGASLAAGPVFYPWPDDPVRISRDRVLTQMIGRWTTDGYRVGARIALERALFADRTSADKLHAVASYGEAAVGIFIEADLRLRDEREWAATAGLTLRLPAAFGIVCCTVPSR